MNPSFRGALSELIVSSDLMAKGYEVYRALSPSSSCDLIVIVDKKPLRVEVRTGYKRLDGSLSASGRGSIEGKYDVLAVVVGGEIVYVFEEPDANFA